MKPNNINKSNANVKWKEILVLWLIVIGCFWLLWSCAGNKRVCSVMEQENQILTHIKKFMVISNDVKK